MIDMFEQLHGVPPRRRRTRGPNPVDAAGNVERLALWLERSVPAVVGLYEDGQLRRVIARKLASSELRAAPAALPPMPPEIAERIRLCVARGNFVRPGHVSMRMHLWRDLIALLRWVEAQGDD